MTERPDLDNQKPYGVLALAAFEAAVVVGDCDHGGALLG